MHMQMLYSPLRVLTAEEADVVYALPTLSSQAMPALPAQASLLAKSHKLIQRQCVLYCGNVMRASRAAPAVEPLVLLAHKRGSSACPVSPCAHAAQSSRLNRQCGRRYVPLYASRLLAGGGHRCAPAWDARAAAALLADFWADAPALLLALGAKPHWAQLSEREALFRAGCGGEGGVPLMCHPLAAQVLWATPEALTEPHPLHGRARFMGRAPAHNNSLAVPYLGRVHRLSMQGRAAALAAASVVADKRVLAAVAEGPGVTDAMAAAPEQAALAQEVARVCAEHGQECAAAPPADFLAAVEAQRRAWFCVVPPGRTPTSVALADCFATGLAVPAMFDEYLYDLLPFADVLPYRAMAAYVPLGDAVTPGVSYLDHLAAYGQGQREAMLRAMQGMSQALQYAVRSQLAQGQQEAWRSCVRLRAPAVPLLSSCHCGK